MHRTIQLICWLGGLAAGALSLWLGYEVAVLTHAGMPLPASKLEIGFVFAFLFAAMLAFGVIADKAAEHADRG